MSLTQQLPQLTGYAGRFWRSPIASDARGPKGLFISYALTRLILILIPLGLFWYPNGKDLGTDIHLYWTWAEVIGTGHYPIADPMWQYPPLAGFVFMIGTQFIVDPMLSFMALALAADFAIFFMLYRQARKSGSLAAPWTYVLFGLAVGPVLLARFDLFPTLFAVAALLMLNKPVRSGLMLGIGALLKVWPAFLIVAYKRSALPRAIAALAAVVIAGSIFVISWGPNAGSFLAEQGQRGLQIESVGAAPYVLANFFGYDLDTIFRYGSLEIDATGAGLIGSLMTIAGFVVMGAIAYRRLRGRLEHVAGADIALAIVLISITTSRVFSPQYMTWVAGIAAVCMLSSRTRMKPVVYLTIAVAVFGQLVYPANYGSMIDGSFVGVACQLARIILLVIATVWACVIVFRSPTNRDHDDAPAADMSTAPLASTPIESQVTFSTSELEPPPTRALPLDQ